MGRANPCFTPVTIVVVGVSIAITGHISLAGIPRLIDSSYISYLFNTFEGLFEINKETVRHLPHIRAIFKTFV